MISTCPSHCVDRAVDKFVLYFAEEFTVQIFLFADLLLRFLLRNWHEDLLVFSNSLENFNEFVIAECRVVVF